MMERINPRMMKAKMAQHGLYCTLEWVTAGLDWLQGEIGHSLLTINYYLPAFQMRSVTNEQTNV